MYRLKVLCQQIRDLSACDLVIANLKTDENNYHPNMVIAWQMNLASKELIKLSKKLKLSNQNVIFGHFKNLLENMFRGTIRVL